MKRLLTSWGITIGMVLGLAYIPNFIWFFGIIFWFGAIMTVGVLLLWDNIKTDKTVLDEPDSICPRWLDLVFDLVIVLALLHIGHPVYAAFYVIFFTVITQQLENDKAKARKEYYEKRKLGTAILDSVPNDDSDCPKCDGWGLEDDGEGGDRFCEMCDGTGEPP